MLGVVSFLAEEKTTGGTAKTGSAKILPVSFPIGLSGLNGVDLSRILGNPSGALPFSVAFDARGNAIFRKLGLLKPEELAQWVEKFASGH